MLLTQLHERRRTDRERREKERATDRRLLAKPDLLAMPLVYYKRNILYLVLFFLLKKIYNSFIPQPQAAPVLPKVVEPMRPPLPVASAAVVAAAAEAAKAHQLRLLQEQRLVAKEAERVRRQEVPIEGGVIEKYDLYFF